MNQGKAKQYLCGCHKYYCISKTWKTEEKVIVLGAKLAYKRLHPSEMGLASQGSEEEKPKGQPMQAPFLPLLLIYQVHLEYLLLLEYTALL